MTTITQRAFTAVIEKELGGLRPALNELRDVSIPLPEVEPYSNTLVRSLLVRMREAEEKTHDRTELLHLLATVIAFVRYDIPQFVDIWRSWTEDDLVRREDIDDDYVLDTMIALYATKGNLQQRYLTFSTMRDFDAFMQIAAVYDGTLSRDLAEMGIDVDYFQKKYNVLISW